MNSRNLNFLADLIETQRLPWPLDALDLRSSGIGGDYEECCRWLSGAATAGLPPAAAAWMLHQIANERATGETIEAAIQPVVTGPCLASGMRGTEDAFRDIIDHATNSILITGFALHNGPSVLAHLAQKMDAQPTLKVVLCLDVSRAPGDSSDSQAIIAAFTTRFRQIEWPGRRAPRLYYDTRLDTDHWRAEYPGGGSGMFREADIRAYDAKLNATPAKQPRRAKATAPQNSPRVEICHRPRGDRRRAASPKGTGRDLSSKSPLPEAFRPAVRPRQSR